MAVKLNKDRPHNMSDSELYKWIYQERIIINPETECHEWQGQINDSGYGVFHYKKRMERVHRWIFSYLKRTKLTSKDYICHECDNPVCCNINHLFLGNAQINQKDMDNKGRRSPPPILRGTEHGQAKLSNEQIEEIEILLIEKKLKQYEIAKLYDVSRITINRINVKRKRKLT